MYLDGRTARCTTIPQKTMGSIRLLEAMRYEHKGSHIYVLVAAPPPIVTTRGLDRGIRFVTQTRVGR